MVVINSSNQPKSNLMPVEFNSTAAAQARYKQLGLSPKAKDYCLLLRNQILKYSSFFPDVAEIEKLSRSDFFSDGNLVGSSSFC